MFSATTLIQSTTSFDLDYCHSLHTSFSAFVPLKSFLNMSINQIVKTLQWLLMSLSKSQCPARSPQDYSFPTGPYLYDLLFYQLPPWYLCFSCTGFLPFSQTWQPCTCLTAFAPPGPSACNAPFIWLIPLPPSGVSFMFPLPVRLYHSKWHCLPLSFLPALLRHSLDPSVFYFSPQHQYDILHSYLFGYLP